MFRERKGDGVMQATVQHERIPGSGTYALGDQPRERERLDTQVAMLRPATERLFREAGIRPGMRVLDAGCGTGEVALLVADLVGSTGSVVAVDRSPEMLATVRRRALERGHRRIETAEADLNEITELADFDVVVGRLVLMHQPDPVQTLRQLAGLVRVGGVIAFLEYHFLPPTSWPRRPLFEQVISWSVESLRRAGIDMDFGLRLYAMFRDAGLPGPAVRLDPLVGTGEALEFNRLLAETVHTCLPLIERFGMATRDEVGIETLEERLRAEARAIDGMVIGPIQGCAWTRLPA
jgi:SAM-dependent methyltransferase